MNDARKAYLKAYLKVWRAKNRDRVDQLNREYYQAHKEEIVENKMRSVYVAGVYVGMAGMTRKQRQAFQEEMNKDGKTNGPRSERR